MEYITVKDAAEKWHISERTVRKYCEQGRIEGVINAGSVWVIPAEVSRSTDSKSVAATLRPLAKKVVYQKQKNNHFGIYEYLQVNLAYSSSRMASNRLTREQVTEIYRTGKVSVAFEPMKIDDVIEITNHFRCMRYVVDTIQEPLNIYYFRKIHQLLFRGTVADQEGIIQIGEFRCMKNKYGVLPSSIYEELRELVDSYEAMTEYTLNDILSFHANFELIHPFEDGNGRVGRAIMVKECLRHNIEPFIIDDKQRGDYHRGISQWRKTPNLLHGVAQHAQKRFQGHREICDLMEYCRPATGRGAR